MLILQNKTKLFATTVCFLSISIANSGGPSGNYANNAPSYNNCTSCHSGAINTGNGAVEILGLPTDGYVPGESYSLTISVSGTHSRGYGFQMASQTGNDNAGTFSLGSSSENVELNGNRIQHSTRTISGEWIVEWLAPSSDVGDVTFSISGMATGGNSGNGGDDVYTGAVELPAFIPVIDNENLFLSEYIEASSGSHKAIEIYNPTAETVDLSAYFVKHSRNGAGWGMYDSNTEYSEFTHQLNGTLPSGEVYVLAADQANPLTILPVTDEELSYPSVVHFNGDDAIGLFHNDVLIDVIGVETEEGAWDVAGVSNGTQDHKLVRKSTVISGNIDWSVSAGTNADNSEWIVETADADDQFNITLGSHIYGTGGENIAPFASAGYNQNVLVGSEVILDGSGSADPDGTIESYNWTQTAGTLVELSSSSNSEVSFIAPSSEDSLSFTLTVTDNDGATASSTVYVKTAQGASNAVFFSEYAEGSSFNKYLEIFNGTGDDIDLSLYAISSCSNGCDDESAWDYPSNITFETGTIVSSGDVYVISTGLSADPAILAEADDNFTYLSNGNDAFAIVDASSGMVIDIIGDRGSDPGDGWEVAGVPDATVDHTLVRKSSIETGNSDWESSAGTDASDSEWIVYDNETWDYLGFHSQSVDAPLVAVNSVSPVFITDQTEIEFSAAVTTPSGSVSSVIVKYGTNGQLLNEAELYQDNGDIWAGTIPAQQGNIVLQMKVYATNSEGVEGQSIMVERIIASSTLSAIADLYNSQSTNEIVTVRGIVTIGSSLLHPTYTKVYIQDVSGRGLSLFSFESHSGIERGDELEVVGYTHMEGTTFELVDFEYKELSSQNTIPDPLDVTPSGSNSNDYEGTLISFIGTITDMPTISNMTNLEIDGETNVVIWNSTGIDVSNFIVGYRGQFIGVGSQYNGQYQLLVGYQSDIATVVGVDDDILVAERFELIPAYPNPFNPTTKISFAIDTPSEIEINVYDVNGKVVHTILKGYYQSGMHGIEWNASEFASGMYFVHLVKQGERRMQKVMLLK